jgi:hypothetical protein
MADGYACIRGQLERQRQASGDMLSSRIRNPRAAVAVPCKSALHQISFGRCRFQLGRNASSIHSMTYLLMSKYTNEHIVML